MAERGDIFAGTDPFEIAQRWLTAAEKTEPNDPNAIALATVDPDGLPNVRMVLLKDITNKAFVFYTNFESKKGQEIEKSGKVAFVMHWKSLRRQIRVRGVTSKIGKNEADTYFKSRSLESRWGAWASKQSRPLGSRAELMADVAKVTLEKGTNPPRPPFWGGIEIIPSEIEFWSDGAFRLHDRFRWTRENADADWQKQRLCP